VSDKLFGLIRGALLSVERFRRGKWDTKLWAHKQLGCGFKRKSYSKMYSGQSVISMLRNIRCGTHMGIFS
jgi:hypothetical protein